METAKEYSNGEVTIVWKANLCTHSANCAKGLPKVFQPREKPWIKPHQATSEEIIDQVNKCPSGALTYYINSKNADNGQQ
ncbi:MAG: (4Fe-4S)-binding protein [Bacteroidota bacterium]